MYPPAPHHPFEYFAPTSWALLPPLWKKCPCCSSNVISSVSNHNGDCNNKTSINLVIVRPDYMLHLSIMANLICLSISGVIFWIDCISWLKSCLLHWLRRMQWLVRFMSGVWAWDLLRLFFLNLISLFLSLAIPGKITLWMQGIKSCFCYRHKHAYERA